MTNDRTNDSREQNENGSDRKGNLLETIFTCLSAVTILALVIYLIMKIIQPVTPAEFKLSHSTPEKRGEHWHVEVSAVNVGDEAVREVEIEGTLETLTANASIDWLPGNSTREATLVFDQQPTGTVELAVKGYLMS